MMEAGGFRVRVDLSQFFSDIKKFSCIYVDLSRDRQIADVVDRISELFGIERPLCLLDERFYLPESENVNVLRDSNVVKVLKALHFQSKEHFSTTDCLTKSANGREYLRLEDHPEQVSVKSNNTNISENSGPHGFYQIEKVNSSLYHTDKETFHERTSKKRKCEDFVESKHTNGHVNILQQDLEPEIHYQKKCKRKKERVKKEVLNGNSLEHLKDKLEEKNTDEIHLDTKNNRKKKKNKAGQINGDITEHTVLSVVLDHSSLEIIRDNDEQATCDSGSLNKHKKKRKEYLTSPDTHKTHDSKLLHSTDLKKRKKKLSQNNSDTDMAQVQSLPLSCEKSDMESFTTCSQAVQKCKNDSTVMCQDIDVLANSGIKNHDTMEYTESDFALRAVSSTPNSNDGCKISEAADFPLQDSTNTHDSTQGNCLDSATTKPKRKRVRIRKHKRKNNIQNDNVVSLPSVIQRHAVLQSSVPPRKHIRFEDEVCENLKEDRSHKEVDSDNDTNIRNKTIKRICDSKNSPNVNLEFTQELTAETEVTDSLMKNSFENSIPKCLISKNNATSLPQQVPLHQQWALNTANLNLNSKESLQKLLTLGKQSSVPVVFERKSHCNNSASVSESSTLVLKQNNNRSDEETCHYETTPQVVDLAAVTYLETDPNAVDPLRYPQLKGKPKKDDIIAFKTLKMTSNYTPDVSGFIIAKVLSICEDTLEMSLQIEAGEEDLEAPKGKFSIDSEDFEMKHNESKLRQMNWNELMDVRILFP